MTFLIPATLFLTVASLMVVGGAIFALFLFFPLFLLALVGVLAGTADRTCAGAICRWTQRGGELATES